MSEISNVFSLCVTVIVIILSIVYGYYKKCHNYWKRIDVPYIPGKFPFGSVTSVILRRETFTGKIGKIYRKMKQKGYRYVGLYFFTRKSLLLIDPEIIKSVLSTDFQHFSDRGIYHDEKNDPLSAHLVAISGEKWKQLRQKLTPTFSSGKLKSMFVTVLKCAEQLTEALECRKKEDPIEMKDLAARYTIDVIGSCAFGIECNSLTNPEAEFRRIGRMVFQGNFVDGIKRFLIRNVPSIARKFRIKVINPKVSKFFMKVVQETIDYRREKKITRNDFLQLLMELMDKRVDDDQEVNSSVKSTAALTMSEAAAHAFVFFLAGFETSASTITFALYELATNTYIQERLRKEVFRVLKKYDAISYDAIMEMRFMECVLLETMRKYPTFVILMRKCTRDYNLPDSNITLEKGVPVIIPVYALHHDPEFFPEPEQFKPERFENDQNKSKLDHVYLPFGNGPRICIGSRFAMIQMKVAITVLLLNFKFTLNKKTNVPLVMNPTSFILSPLGGTWLNVFPLSPEEKF